MSHELIPETRAPLATSKRLVFGMIAITLLPCAGIAALLVIWLTTFIDPAPDQDGCSFNSVGNDEYRELLSRAKEQDWTIWPGLSKGLFWPSEHPLASPSPTFELALGTQLQGFIEQLRPSPAFADQKLAAAHAIMRSIKADYVNVWRIPDLRQEGKQVTEQVHFNYFLPQIRFAPLCFLCLNWWPTTIGVMFSHDLSTDSYTFDRIIVRHSDLKYYPIKERSTFGTCPRLSASGPKRRGSD